MSGCLRRVPVAALALSAFLVLPARAGEKPAAAWPEFHGPRRNSISPETGLLKNWPKGGPRLLWKATGLGRGYAGVSVAGGRIFTSGDFGKEQRVIALGLDGKQLWQAPNGKSWKGPFPGSRTTPTVRDGVAYHMNPHGRLAAYRAASGKEIWAAHLGKECGAKPPRWALAENVFIDGRAVFCAPGGPKGRIVALHKDTGKRLWTNTEIAEAAAYCSPIVFTHDGVRQLVTILHRTVVSVDVRTGKLLWKHPHATPYAQNVTPPVVHRGSVYVTGGHGMGLRRLRIEPGSRGVRQAWINRDLDNCHGALLLVDGLLYGSGCRIHRKGLVCVDAESGKTAWNRKDLGKVSLAYADGMFYAVSDKRRVSLLAATRAGCRVAGRFDLPTKSRALSLAHPVICGGRLYIRHWDELFAYHIGARSLRTPVPGVRKSRPKGQGSRAVHP
jgi:outer membrane protein assembly factor BamB